MNGEARRVMPIHQVSNCLRRMPGSSHILASKRLAIQQFLGDVCHACRLPRQSYSSCEERPFQTIGSWVLAS